MSKSFSANDVKEHGTVDKGLYIIIDNGVYEMVCASKPKIAQRQR